MGVTFPGGLENIDKRIALPLSDGFFIPLTGPPTRLLRRPLQSRPQKSADVVVMQRDAEVSKNQIGDALGGPKFVGPTVGFCSLAEQLFEFLLLLEGQACCRAGMRLGSEAVGFIGEFEPAVNGTRFDTYDASDIFHFVTRLDCLNGLASS